MRRLITNFFLPFSLLVVGLCLVACSTSQQTATIGAGSTGSTLTGTLSTPLVHTPTGTATLTWSPITRQLAVRVHASGLAASSSHPVYIQTRTCTIYAQGNVFTLNPLVSDTHGVGSATTILKNVNGGIPASGWFLNIFNGPSLTTELQARAIACGTIHAHPASMGGGVQTVVVHLTKTNAPDEAAAGTAQITMTSHTLQVTLTLRHLVPGSTHMAHIHAGSCTSQGAVVYPLTSVVADAHGNARSTTTIQNIPDLSPLSLYINVHEAGTMAGMNTPSGFNPIVCANLLQHANARLAPLPFSELSKGEREPE